VRLHHGAEQHIDETTCDQQVLVFVSSMRCSEHAGCRRRRVWGEHHRYKECAQLRTSSSKCDDADDSPQGTDQIARTWDTKKKGDDLATVALTTSEFRIPNS
jgi:hypothetical protein